jgi:DNA ligase-1
MLFRKLSEYFEKLEKTSSRLEMTDILARIFSECSSEEIDKVCYLSLGILAPKYEGLEFNLAGKMMIRVLAKAAGVGEGEVKRVNKEAGDLGKAASKLFGRKRIKGKDLKVGEVFRKLVVIAKEGGKGSVGRKIKMMATLFGEVDWLSVKYLARIPLGRLRLGFSEMTVLDALSWMKKKNKSLRGELERAFNVLADIGKVAQVFKAKGLTGIKNIKSEVGVPIRAAKAERLPTAEKILEKMEGGCAIEPKMDGFRVQIHIDKKRKFELAGKTNMGLFEDKKKYYVRIFSRNLENTTYMFPDIVEAAQKIKVSSAILDGEAIAYDTKTQKFLPFQETVQRKRKHGVGEKVKEMPLKVFVFDLLYLNGKTLIFEPFEERRKMLEWVLKKSKGEEMGILLTEQKKVSKEEEFNEFFKQMVGEGLEGLVAKKLEAVYQAGARNYNWVKYKRAMKGELTDTVDCVVMGYYKGRGKRTSFGVGAFLVGVVGKEKILSTSKVGTGLTEEEWREMYKRCEKLKAVKKPADYEVNKNLNPDVWCKPGLVVEIEADEITRSPIHKAGLALRFPRLKRFRDDKDVREATKVGELYKLYRLQGRK